MLLLVKCIGRVRKLLYLQEKNNVCIIAFIIIPMNKRPMKKTMKYTGINFNKEKQAFGIIV